MFEDQKVELLPEKTTMFRISAFNQNLNTAVAAAVNVANLNVAGCQVNVASAQAAAGSNFGG
jgi:hypothetical protein